MENNSPEAFLEYVVKGLVDNPEAVKIEKRIDEMGVLLTLDVSPEDMGKVIGRQGATAKAIRTLLRVVGMKSNARVNMKIKEPERSTHVRSDAPASAPVADSVVASDVDAAMEDLKADL